MQINTSSTRRGIPYMTNSSLIIMLFYVIISCGIYIPIWFLNRKQEFNRLNSSIKIGDNAIIFLTVGYVFSLILTGISTAIDKIALETGTIDALMSASIVRSVDLLISLILGIVVIIQSFKVRKIFQDHFKARIQFSGFLTFLFTFFYIQHKMNIISDLRR